MLCASVLLLLLRPPCTEHNAGHVPPDATHVLGIEQYAKLAGHPPHDKPAVYGGLAVLAPPLAYMHTMAYPLPITSLVLANVTGTLLHCWDDRPQPMVYDWA